MITAERIQNLLEQGENQSVEFKNAKVAPADLAKEFVAFANTAGGEILLGVDDDGSISGIETTVVSEAWVANIARDSVVPALSVAATELEFLGKKILHIAVPKGKDKPYQTLQNRFLIRVGSTNRSATQGELMRLFQQAGVFHFDSVGVERTGLKDLNFTKLDKYFDRFGVDFSRDSDKENLLENTDILNPEGTATLGGLLIFGSNPQRFLPNACIAFAHFRGSEISEELLDRQEISGTLDQQVDTALAVIKNNLRAPSVIAGAKTKSTIFQYPDKVFRELLANAVIHRNYSIHGSQIRVFLFDDRIEFHSPGKLPNTITLAKITRGVSYAVNPILLKFMQNMNYVDKLGRGIPMVYQAAVQNGKRIELEEIGEEFVVTLFF